TNAGLWRYMIGDTIQFTSTNPYRIQISGRTKNFINAFGEEVIIDNAENALDAACRETGAVVSEYTAAPVFLEDNNSACHEYLIEFEKEPDDLDNFTNVLDKTLQNINSDYEAKRTADILLKKLKVTSLPRGTFFEWLKSKGKVGGQNKVPRLFNNRKYVDEILKFVS
ncbi:MAG: GH3 auxin-responsive promoter family protein, partial [Bacteroidales bacterium]|nr:GH3 auxin-responsive promoter family protein [Bacteroidales bacterium]